jgi:tetratricopeptide (TPR) repeat protein
MRAWLIYGDVKIETRFRTGYAAASLLIAAIILTACGTGEETRLLYGRGIVHYGKKELEMAAECFQRVYAKDRSYTGAGIMLAKAWYFSGKRKEAREVLEDVLKEDPSHTGALYWMARALVADAAARQGDNSESRAIELLRRALEIDGYHIQARTLLALLYEKKKMYRESLFEYKAALQEEESLVSARANLSILYQRLGLRDRAMGEIDKAIKIAYAAGIPGENLNAIKKEIEAQ